jgi:hypothetical protein
MSRRNRTNSLMTDPNNPNPNLDYIVDPNDPENLENQGDDPEIDEVADLKARVEHLEKLVGVEAVALRHKK